MRFVNVCFVIIIYYQPAVTTGRRVLLWDATNVGPSVLLSMVPWVHLPKWSDVLQFRQVSRWTVANTSQQNNKLAWGRGHCHVIT